ncbi:hypothetical protein Tco_1076124, partial [Tanacetum coccineum]
MTPLTVPSPVATPAAVETEGFLTELGAQLAEERRARLELAEVVDGKRRWQEPRGVLPCVSALRLVACDRADTHFLNRMWHATYLVYSVSSKRIRADRLYHLVRRYCRKIMDREWSRGSIGKSGEDRFGNLIIFLTIFGNANSDKFVVTSRGRDCILAASDCEA